MPINTKYKDSVFSFLFSDPDLLRELYCALEDVSLPSSVPVTINTLENVLFMELINDISFMIGDKMVILTEHQSSINPNMAIRLLMYVARIYERMFDPKKLYSSKQLPVPRPEFFVLYNGTAPFPDEMVLKLSESFYKAETLGLPKKEFPALELVVRVININEGRHKEIAGRCRKLHEYSVFISKVRYFLAENGNNKEDAIRSAIKYCTENDILKGFFELHAKEVFNMLITEWNTEDAKKVWYEEGQEDVARKAFAKGATLEFVQEITGFDIEKLKNLQAECI